MIKYPITYTDFNGNVHVDNLWFHISKTSVLTLQKNQYNEIIELGKELQQKAAFVEEAEKSLANRVVETGGEITEATLKEEDPFNKDQIVVADAVRTIAQLLDKVVDLAYGERSDDGMRFVRTREVIDNFKQTVAYDAFVEKMLSDPNEMINFITKLMDQAK